MPGVVISAVLGVLLIAGCVASIRSLRDAIAYLRVLARSMRAGFAAAHSHAIVEGEAATYSVKARRRSRIF